MCVHVHGECDYNYNNSSNNNVFDQYINVFTVQGTQYSVTMLHNAKERKRYNTYKKRKEKERQETVKSSKSLNAWLKPGTRSKTQETTHNADVKKVLHLREQ